MVYSVFLMYLFIIIMLFKHVLNVFMKFKFIHLNFADALCFLKRVSPFICFL